MVLDFVAPRECGSGVDVIVLDSQGVEVRVYIEYIWCMVDNLLGDLIYDAVIDIVLCL